LEKIAQTVACAMQPRIEDKRLSLRIVREPGCPYCDALVDRALVTRVFSNILDNAIRFSSHEQSLEIRISRIEIAPCDGARLFSLQIEFRDEAIGIPSNELELIFEKFAQSSTTRSAAGGTGLGLAICKEIMHLHNGSIRASNNDRGGATFTLTFPLQSESLATADVRP
jgi:signal transduction histidine kinase